ncbi:MAG: F0F1 ATP synthase subunit delta [Alphaproteobacteria bacterium]
MNIVIAQAVNFFVLIWLMVKFLYRPIINAMNEREKRIAWSIKEAREQAENARKEAETFRSKNEEFDKKREEALAKMQGEVEDLRKAMMTEIKSDVDGLRLRWKEELDGERSSMATDARRLFAKQFSNFASKALSDLAEQGLEDRMIDKFISKIEGLDKKEVEAFKKAIESTKKVAIRSSFKVSKDMEKGIVAALKKVSNVDSFEVETKLSEELVCGIEVDAGSWSVLWSLNSYIESFASELDARLEELSSVAVKGVAA